MGRPVNEIDKKDKEEQGDYGGEDTGKGKVFFSNRAIDGDDVLDDNG